jgi:succinate-semialdehyde dehydrogenase/glutarate-semialdehyde dehydrogenase
MPWNYPFWQVFRFAVPALTAGNGVILKHASNVSLCGVLLEKLFFEAGYPSGIFQFFPIHSDKVNAVLENPIIKGVSLTGSTPAGCAVAGKAGSLIKKSVLELGGNNALVVFEDADLQRTIDICIQARFQNTGQSCIAGKRLLLHANIAQDFLIGLKEKVAILKVGNPKDRDTYIGVMARESLAVDLELQLQKSISMGANLFYGGNRDATYFEPTIVTEVKPGMPIFDEETFGPLLAVTQFKDEQEALNLISQSKFGLGVSLFTKSEARINRMIPELEEGAVFINELVKSDPRLPFGGVKISGYGRELSLEGIREFVNKKTVYRARF